MLTHRITLSGDSTDPEDYLFSSLGVIFPDDITNQHGDAAHHVIYTSPTLGPITLTVADPKPEDTRLFAHSVWNAAVQLAALVEEGQEWRSLSPSSRDTDDDDDEDGTVFGKDGMWDVRGKSVVELGAGTGLAGIVAALCGASDVVLTDYPAREILRNIGDNVARNVQGKVREGRALRASVVGHEWGVVGDDAGAAVDGDGVGEAAVADLVQQRGAFDRVLVADCLWMPWAHRALMRSICWFMSEQGGRAWVVAGFHSGRAKMATFFDATVLAEEGLEIEMIWERDAEEKERSWSADRGVEDVTARKRWLVIAVLKRKGGLC